MAEVEDRTEGQVTWQRRIPWALVAAVTLFLILGGAYVSRALPRGANNFDSARYEAMTKQWVTTGVYGYGALDDPGSSDAVVTPGYPTFLAPFYRLSAFRDPQTPGGPYLAIFVVQLLIGAVLLCLIWLYAQMVATRRAANIAVWLLAPMFTFYNTVGVVLTSLLATTLIMAYFLMLARALSREDKWLAVGSGLVLAAGLLTRPTLGIASLVPLVMGFTTVIRPKVRLAPFVLAGLAAPFAVWILRNWVSLGRPMLIEGREDPLLGGIDPYFRGSNETLTQTHGLSAGIYKTLSEYDPTVTPLRFLWRIMSQNLRNAPLELIGWFTVGKIQYLAYGAAPAAATEGAIDSILVSSVSTLGVTGAILSIRWRDLMPTAVMLVVWLAQNALIVPDQRYWFDVLPFLATLSGALVAAAWGRAPISKAAAASRAEA